MSDIDPEIKCHQLAIDPTYKTIVQRKRKIGGEKEQVIAKEIGKFLKAGFIREIKYL